MASATGVHLNGERMRQIADRLARSGQYAGAAEIEHELKRQGFLKNRSLLDDLNWCHELDTFCDEARGRLALRSA